MIHAGMLSEIRKSGGKIDAVYFCPSLIEEHSVMRKPNVGMALQARKDFSVIRFKQSVMVGDSLSDMVFGKRLKMTTVFICTDKKIIAENSRLIDLTYPDLFSFASDLS
jgi:HAD superfamily hydrolase (TIGR01662 family)